MPLTELKTPPYKSPKELIVSWDTFRKGWNTLLRENEIDKAEMVSSTNLILKGGGVPTKRWGSLDYYTANATGQGLFLLPIKDASDNIQVISLTNWGTLTKKSGGSYTEIVGASWPSGSIVNGTQIADNAYIVSNNREMVRYNFSTLVNFATLGVPTGVNVTNLSSATGASTWSWRVTAVGKSGGETTASTPVSLASLPQDLSSTMMRLNWTAVSAASGDLVSYNVYRGTLGDEIWIGGTAYPNISFDDFGSVPPDPFRTVPTSDTTGGPKGKFILRYQDRLIISGIPGSPTKVLISGRYPLQERFDWYAGGGFIEIEPFSGESVTGLGVHQEKLVVFKENSVWHVTLEQVTFGSYVILDPKYKLLTASQGCSSHRSIVPVENDLMFSNRKGIYILRYEPQLLTVINANEISAKVRSFFEGLSDADLTTAAGMYADKKYILSFPSSKQAICFDRERLAFTGPWTMPFGVSQWSRYNDSTGAERWIGIDADDNMVTEFDDNYTDDKGTAIKTLFKSRKEDFGDWTLFKTINEIYLNFRYITGNISVNIYIENRTGNLVAAKAITLTGAGSQGTSGIGTDQLGLAQLGLTNNKPDPAFLEEPKRAFIYKSARLYQIEVRTTGKTDNFELLGVKGVGVPQARGGSPSSWNL